MDGCGRSSPISGFIRGLNEEKNDSEKQNEVFQPFVDIKRVSKRMNENRFVVLDSLISLISNKFVVHIY